MYRCPTQRVQQGAYIRISVPEIRNTLDSILIELNWQYQIEETKQSRWHRLQKYVLTVRNDENFTNKEDFLSPGKESNQGRYLFELIFLVHTRKNNHFQGLKLQFSLNKTHTSRTFSAKGHLTSRNN